MNNNIETIREACIKANPEIGELKSYVCNNCGSDDELHYRPIRLADVLLAMSDPEVIITSHKGEFRFKGDEAAYWNLNKDSLTDQSEETLHFLAELLGE